MSDRRALLRNLPAIDRILDATEISGLKDKYPHVILREAAQSIVEKLRKQLLNEHEPIPDVSFDVLIEEVYRKIEDLARPSLRKVINVSGTVLHTNFGRAPLCNSAIAAIEDVARGYSNLEYDLGLGQRGKRYNHVAQLLCNLTGGEAATVVNNNAGAVLLALAALAGGRSALVSRGEMIEIGGSFRIPDVMAAGGVKLIEVGTTNKTHLEDYRNAINSEVALIMKVHTSNYRVLGFTKSVAGETLAELARDYSIPVLEDLGSGLLIDLIPHGLPREPSVREVLATGVDLVTFSGDKLLGGPQAGIIVGRKDLVDTLCRHPMARALRIDKLTLAAMEATLRLYLDPRQALCQIPALSMLTTSAEQLRLHCETLQPQIMSAVDQVCHAEIISSTSTVGGGALPLTELSGWVIALRPYHISVNELVIRLRNANPPVIGRVQDNQFLIDPRTLFDNDVSQLCAALQEAFGKN